MIKERGLTLIEVLVSLAILSAIAGSLLMLLGQQTRQAAALEDRALARIVAENALADYVAAKRTGLQADLSGQETIGAAVFQFTIARTQSGLEGFETVTAHVRKGEGRQVLASLTALQRGVSP